MPIKFLQKADKMGYEADDHERHWQLHNNGKSSLTTEDEGKQVRSKEVVNFR